MNGLGVGFGRSHNNSQQRIRNGGFDTTNSGVTARHLRPLCKPGI